jgi:hypothetical protein
LIVMGNFSAKVGMGDASNEGIAGCHGIGDRNDRGERLLNFCSANNLSITNTCFKQKRENRSWTWESPDQGTHNKIDYILVSRKLMGSVTNSRSFPSADIGSDHQLVMANINKSPIMKQEVGKDKLKADPNRLLYEQKLEEKWLVAPTDDTMDTDTEWRKIWDIIKETPEEVLGTKTRTKQKEWLSDATLELLKERREYKSKRFQHHTMAKHHKYLRRQVRKSAKADREKYIRKICCKVKMQGCRTRPGLYTKDPEKLQGNMRHRTEQSKIRWARY